MRSGFNRSSFSQSRFSRVVRCAALGLVAGLVLVPVLPANAQPIIPTASEVQAAKELATAKKQAVAGIQAQLAEAQTALDAKQIAAALAEQQYLGAKERLTEARAREKLRAATARTATADAQKAQQQAVEMARSVLQGNVPMIELATVLHSGPQGLLDRASTVTTVATSLQGKLDTMQTTQRRAETADLAAKRTAALVQQVAQEAAAAKKAAEQAERDQAAAVQAYDNRRQELVTELADAEQVSVETAAKRQSGLEARAQAARERAASENVPADGQAVQQQAADEQHVADAKPVDDTAAQTAIAFARNQIGKPYVFGAVGPNAYDCSGLTMKAWAAAGKSLGHYTGIQWSRVTHISENQLVPGDLVFWATDASNPDTIFHVALYIGKGRIIQAPRPGKTVEEASVYSWIPPTFFGHP